MKDFRDDLQYQILHKVEVFERLHNISPNVMIIGKSLMHILFSEQLCMFPRDSEIYMFGMKVIVDYSDRTTINLGYINRGGVYRNESCEKKRGCHDYVGYHCLECEVMRNDTL